LKPENVFICRKREADFVKVLDFGISKVRAADAEAVRVTKTGQLVGTPLYMSPEQARGELDVDHRADVYALGVMLFEMVTGRPPFEGTNYFQLLWKHGNEPAPSARTKMPELPEALDAVLLRSLEKKPEARFQSMREMEEALIAVAPELGDPDRPMSLTPRPSSATPAAVVPPPAPPRRPAWVAWSAVAAAIALLGGGFAVVLHATPTTETEAPVTAAAPPAPHEAPSKALTKAHPHEATEPVPGPTVDPVPEGVLPPSPVVVRIESTPPGAVVRLGDEEQGRTPLSLPLPPGAPVDLQLRLSGYAPESLTVVPTEGLTERVRLTPRPRTPSRSDDLPIRMSL
ncbi:MAG: serine/threonine protein kinase, partial [Myxococcales bacterium]|nr:serine/threonine protein kinase [Myxococcales bacterium]